MTENPGRAIRLLIIIDAFHDIARAIVKVSEAVPQVIDLPLP